MKKTIKYNLLIIETIISFILTEVFVYVFELDNHVIYDLIITGIITFLIDTFRIHIYKQVKNDKKFLIVNSIFSIIFSLVILVQTKIQYLGIVSQSLTEDTFQDFKPIDIIKYILIYICVWLVMSIIYFIIEKLKEKKCIQEEESSDMNRKSKQKHWLLYTGTIAICYIIVFLIAYPGSVLADSFSSIYQIIGQRELDNHFPIMYTLFVGIFMKIGEWIGNYNIGVALYSIVQILIIAGILGYFVLWLKQKHVKSIYLLFTILYFIGNALFAIYALTMWKDPLFCIFLFLLMLKLYDIVESNGKKLKQPGFIISMIILNLLIAFLRNNGVFIILLIAIVLAIKYRYSSKKFLIANVTSIIIILFIQGPIYTWLGITTPIEESLGIPIQQIAYTLSVDGEISEEDEAFLNEILPIEEWKSSYNVYIVDSIKWNENFDSDFLSEHNGEFIQVWLRMLLNNFPEYVKAYLLETFGFWSIETKSSYGFVDNYIYENEYNIHKVDLIQEATGLDLSGWIENTDFFGSGTLIWILIISAMMLYIQKKTTYIICLLPGAILWLSIMIATPVAFSLRYVFVLAYALPFILLLPVITKNKDERSSKYKKKLKGI